MIIIDVIQKLSSDGSLSELIVISTDMKLYIAFIDYRLE